ncbi:hypothetical protein DXG03_001872 [Asterophora parasitica]|uniref:Transmembrane protein n=1 Tax=Asterophora parasitica TaxID=117018 RepID=A0A9P7G4G9_9AGAR|nr:hypothetical protein DXG03_001872 [Asterophora parasitica]
MSVRPLVIDDTDPRVRYGGSGWQSDIPGSQDNFGTHGETYNGTLHAATSDGSFAFSFQGNSIRVFGTVNLAPVYGDYGAVAGPNFTPPWECFVDNISIGAAKANPFHENNWLLCNSDRLNDGPHELTFKSQNITKGTLWVDYLQYTPDKPPTEPSVVLVANTDPEIRYDSTWQGVDGVANMTSTNGAKVTFNFTGTKLAWLGYIPIERPGNGTSASYSIDGESPTTFFLAGHPPFDGTSLYNQNFFTTPDLPNGPHTIVVTYQGNSSFTPLTLDHIYLTVAPTSTTHPSSPKKSLVGTIVGCVVGGVAAILFVGFLLLFLRRRNREKGSEGSSRGLIQSPNEAVAFTMSQPPSASSAASPSLPSPSNVSLGASSGSGFVSDSKRRATAPSPYA